MKKEQKRDSDRKHLTQKEEPQTDSVKAQPEKPIPLAFKVLIPLVILILFELIARGLSVTVLKNYLSRIDLRTKLEKIYIPPPEPSNDNVMRLYVYGGSTTQGFPNPKVGFVPQLSYQLHHIFENKNIDVKNLGWSGFTSTMDRYSVTSSFWHKPDAMIVYTSHNEFVHPEIDNLLLYRSMSHLRDNSVLFRLLLATSNSLHGQTKADNEEPVERKRVPYFLVKPYYFLKLAILKQNYRSMVKIAQKSSVPIIFITATSNIGQWSPPEMPVTIFPPGERYQQDLKKVRTLIEEDNTDEAEKTTKIYLKKNPNDSSFLYFQAQIEAKRQNWDLAKKYFEQSKNSDPLQWRANDEINNFVRSLEDKKTVWVLDADKIFKENSPHNIPGYSLFLDNVHPNIDGHNLLANSIVELLRQDRIVEKDWWDKTNAPLPEDELLKQMDVTQDDQFQIAEITALYCIKNPFFNFQCARDYLEKAEKIKPTDWQIPASRSVIAYLTGNIDETKKQYKIAQDYYGAPISDKDALKIPYLQKIKEKLL